MTKLKHLSPVSLAREHKGTRQEATHQRMVNRVLWWFNQATARQVDDGVHWYKDAQTFCATVASELGRETQNVAAVVSLLSPQTSWPQNKINAALLCSYRGTGGIVMFASGKQRTEALNALDGVFTIPATRPKVHSFWDNIVNPESTRVTVDRHAVKAALGRLDANEVRITALQYRRIEAAYQDAAKQLKLWPYQVQAVVWVTYKSYVGR